MAVTREQTGWLEDLFAVLPGSRVRRMFGGAGVFRDGLMYALMMGDGQVALKADAATAPDFRAEGMSEWHYPDRKTSAERAMGYWYMPERLADDEDELRQWALRAFECACRADAAKPAKQRKRQIS